MATALNNKNYFNGTERIASPEETLNRITPLIKQFGITRLADITGLDYVGIPVYAAMRPNAKGLSVSQGKGVTRNAAKVSALMEAIELWHAENDTLERLESTYTNLKKTDTVVDIKGLPTRIEVKDSDKALIEWVSAKDIFNQCEKYVPYECVHTNYTEEKHELTPQYIFSSNGLASGNNLVEAQLHGLYEVIERDAYSCWSLKTQDYKQSTKINVSSVHSSPCKPIIEQIKNANLLVGIWDITSDINIPCFLVRVISTDETDIVRPAIGMGCHLNADIALSRALTEAAQSRLTYIAGARDDMAPSQYSRFKDHQKIHQKWKISVTNNTNAKTFESFKDASSSSLEQDVRKVRQHLNNIGVNDVLCVDLSQKQYGLSVVRMIVPHLEGSENYYKMRMGSRAKAIMAEFWGKEWDT